MKSPIKLDLSDKPIMKQTDGWRYLYIEPNNLYSLNQIYPPESIDEIYSKDLINKTKFYFILIKEWFYACKVGGKITIEMKSNKILSYQSLVKYIKLLLKNKIKIIIDDLTNEIISFKKIKSALLSNDSIDSWTFGIITNGKRIDLLKEEIESIFNLNIPNFEIIICASCSIKELRKKLGINQDNKHVIFIPFNNPLPWITKKKNLICKKAKYENLVITHDRFIFDKNWHMGMKRYGNYFEVLSCVIKDPLGRRCDDWLTKGTHKDINNLGLLDYKDWDINGFICGGFYILKKEVWRKCPWNESLIWGQAEDVEVSKRFLKEGFIARFNPYSICYTTKERGDAINGWPKFKLYKNRFISIKDRPFLRRIKLYLKLFAIKYLFK